MFEGLIDLASNVYNIVLNVVTPTTTTVIETETVYASYTDTYDDNPYLDERCTGFVYATLMHAWIAMWPVMQTSPQLAATSIENALLGVYDMFTDNDEQAWKGVLYEVARMIESNLEARSSEEMPELKIDRRDTATNEYPDMQLSVSAFFQCVFDDDFEGAIALGGWVEQLFEGEGVGYQVFTTTVLSMLCFQWSIDVWPEFTDVLKVSDDDDEN